MLNPRGNLGTFCLTVLAVTFFYGCGSTDPDLDVAETYDDSPLQFGISFSGSKLKLDWDAVDSATQYRLTQTAGDTDIITDPGRERVIEALSVTFDISTLTFDPETIEFQLEALVGTAWQPIGIQNALGSAVASTELQFSWADVGGVTQYRLKQLEGDATIIEGELLIEALQATIDITDIETDASTLVFSLEAYVPDLAEWQVIPLGDGFNWVIALFKSPLRLEYPLTARTIVFGWGAVPDATQYRLTQTAGRLNILPDSQKLYTADQFIDRFEVPVHLFDWGGSRFTLEALVDSEWQLIGQQDTAGGSSPLVQTFSEADAYATTLGSQLAFGSNLSLSEDGKTMAVGAIGETSVPLEQREGDPIEGETFFGIELRFSWDEVTGVTQYRLKQLEGDAVLIEDELLVEGLLTSIRVTDPELDSSTLVFSLEANDPVSGWQEIPLGAGFTWESVTTVIAARNAGAVFVYDLESDEKTKIKSPRIDAEDVFGSAVALSDDGQILVISAIGEDSDVAGVQAAPDPELDNNNATESGAVYVYSRAGNEWDLDAYIKAPVIDAIPEDGIGDVFGWALALSGDGSTLAVSALGEDGGEDGLGVCPESNDLSNSGAVYIYRRLNGAWLPQPEACLKASNADVDDLFGQSLTISADGNYLAVSALAESSGNGEPANNDKNRSGAVYVFARDPVTSEWIETSYLKASNAGAGDLFGQSISFDAGANILIVGAPREDQDASGITAVNSGITAPDSGIGAAYLFERTGTGETSSWAQKDFYFKASNANPVAEFGQSVVLSSGGDYLAVGAWGDASLASGINGNQNADTGPGSGAAYIFQRQSDNDSWTQIAFVNEPTATRYLYFGSWMDLALNGTLLGVAGNSLGPNQSLTGIPGTVYLY